MRQALPCFTDGSFVTGRNDPVSPSSWKCGRRKISRRNNTDCLRPLPIHLRFSGSQRTTGFSFLAGVHRIGVDVIHNPFI